MSTTRRLALAAEMARIWRRAGTCCDLTAVRAAQSRILALRGQDARAAEGLEWLESAARGTEDPRIVVVGLGSSAMVRAALGQDEAAAALLTELEAYPGARGITGTTRACFRRWCARR